ncbi:MAG: beta-galactosidase [Phycisphaerae bacterium]
MTLSRFPPIIPGADHLLHGGDYNPEQWLHQPEIITEDFRLFPLAGCNTFSVGIFSWVSMEPQEGVFTFDWLDAIMERMAQAGHRVFLATPSASRPRWLRQKYPQTTRVDEAGNTYPHYSRADQCWTAPELHARVKIINQALAQRYVQHPAMGGWHISNEYYGTCYCAACVQSFQQWLEQRYGNLSALNQAMNSAFWGQTWQHWNEVTPRILACDGLRLEWQRFNSVQIADMLQFEIATVRPYRPDLPITTNFMSDFEQVNFSVSAPYVDFVSNDSYPNYDDHDNHAQQAAKVAFIHDYMRALRQRPWVLMESCPSMVNWQSYAKPKRPGLHIFEMMHAVAHGADGTLYFQWRKGANGGEKHHGAVVDHVGTENTRVFREVAQWGNILRQIAPVRGSLNQADVAVVYDPECRWALHGGPGKIDAKDSKGYMDTLQAHYRALWKQQVTIDVIAPTADLSGYKLVVLPMMYLVSEDFGARLDRFVADGGVAVTTYYTGWQDLSGRAHLGGWPGAGLRKVFGVWAEETDHLMPTDTQSIHWQHPLPLRLEHAAVKDYADVLHLCGAQVAASYQHQYYTQQPAVTVNQYGQGQAWYLGCRLGDDFHDAFYQNLLSQLQIKPWFGQLQPAGITVQCRHAEGRDYYFVLNLQRTANTAKLGTGVYTDLVTGAQVTQTLELGGYGVAVLTCDQG